MTKGPLPEFEAKAIAKVKCENPRCERDLFVKVNKSGWPYAVCTSSDGCGTERRTFGAEAAQGLIDRVTVWDRRHKKSVLTAMDAYALESEGAEIEESDEFQAEEIAPEKPAKKKAKFKLFDDGAAA